MSNKISQKRIYQINKTKMISCNSKASAFFSIIGISVCILSIQSCDRELIDIQNKADMLPHLSDYHIFQGNPSQLNPSPDFTIYELSTQLFTDYAAKQRLIKIPSGQVINPIDDKLPDFPSGTILVKTFYYYHKNQDTSKGKQLI